MIYKIMYKMKRLFTTRRPIIIHIDKDFHPHVIKSKVVKEFNKYHVHFTPCEVNKLVQQVKKSGKLILGINLTYKKHKKEIL